MINLQKKRLQPPFFRPKKSGVQLHGKIGTLKIDRYVLSLSDVGFLLFFRVVSGDEMANPEVGGSIFQSLHSNKHRVFKTPRRFLQVTLAFFDGFESRSAGNWLPRDLSVSFVSPTEFCSPYIDIQHGRKVTGLSGEKGRHVLTLVSDFGAARIPTHENKVIGLPTKKSWGRCLFGLRSVHYIPH